MSKSYQADVTIIGAGIAGIVTTLELLDSGKKILLLDRNGKDRFGGLANEAFGGMTLINTPLQKLNGIKDSVELAIEDWKATGQFDEKDVWPLRWVEYYAKHSKESIYDWLKNKGVKFFPAVQWVERGDYGSDLGSGNSVPRYHVVWGTGYALCQTLIQHIEHHPNRANLNILFHHQFEDFIRQDGHISGCSGKIKGEVKGELDQEHSGEHFEAHSPTVVVACGGINGNLELVKQVWDKRYGEAPDNLLNGSHPSADGHVHEQVRKIGGVVSHLPWMWNYAAGIEHPHPKFDKQGLSLIPPRSALWMDAYGERIGPKPLITGFDTHDLCKQIGQLEHQYSWQVMNYKIAVKEIAISGSEMNPSFRDKKLIRFLKETLFGNKALVNWMIAECPDVIVADTVEELADKMNQLTGFDRVDAQSLKSDIEHYDAQISRGKAFYNDDQLRKLDHLRKWRGDKVRTLKAQKILDPKAGPLIAIRERLISRKSMGGIQTNLNSQVLDHQDHPIAGLYAVGEAAGFGGGGINGVSSLEGTFLSSCILTGRLAAKSIKEGVAA